MHKVTDRSSVQTELSIPALTDACAAAANWPPTSNDRKDPQPAQLDPLYLFGCSLLWHKQGDAAAAWDLIHGLQAGDQGTRVVACALLSKRRTPREIGAAQPRRIVSPPGWEP